MNARRVRKHAELVQNLRYLYPGAVDLRKPKRKLGFEQRLERVDDRPRVGEGGYIGELADDSDEWDRRYRR